MKHWSYGLPLISLLPLSLAASYLSAHPCESLSTWHPGHTTVADFAPPVGVFGLWRPATGAFSAPEIGLPAAALVCSQNTPCLVDSPNDGRSIADFERYEVGADIRYALVFQAVEKHEELVTSLDTAGLELEVAYQQVMGRRLTDLETFVHLGTRRWAALFQEGATQQELALDLSAEELESRVDTPHPRMRRLVDFELRTFTSAANRYAAVFDGYAADQKFYAELSVEDFHWLAHELFPGGYRLKDVESWVEVPSGAMRFAALFERASGDDHVYAIACDRNDLPCSSAAYFSYMEDHLHDRAVELSTGKPSLRLLDIELPRGIAQLPISSLTGGTPAGGSRSRTGEDSPFGEDPPWSTPLPTHCNHAGVLHDAGTNGPP